MSPRRVAASAVAGLAFLAQPACADYAMTGPAKTSVCWGLGIEVCSIREIVGVEQAGRVFKLSMTYGAVDNYKDGKEEGRCTISAKGANGWRFGPHEDPAKDVKPIALDKNGKPEYINADQIMFKCVKIRPLH